jgi:N-acetylneuraminate synthase/N,N'-diacetyllegionaminate synthase
MNPIKIESRQIAPGHPTLIIAEIGVNHDGSVQKALELVRIASNCGADAVKLQVYRTTSLLHPSCQLAGYQKERAPAEDPIELLRRYELSVTDIARVVRNIRELRMIPLATPFSPSDMEVIDRLRLPAIKIASPDMINRPLLEAAQTLGKPLLISTGAATMEEVQTTAGWLNEWKSEYALLHCVSSYPVPAAEANLAWIVELGKRFEVPIGYSDHTTESLSGALAAGAGALIIEKHLTYARDARGPDHAASADPSQFARYVKLVREADVLRGVPGKRVLDIEKDVRTVSRQSLVVRRSIAAGEVIRREDLTVQRPGTGLSAALIDRAVGRRARDVLRAGSMLEWEMLSDAA